MTNCLKMNKAIILAAVMFGLTACASMDNTGYRGGDHRGGGPAGAYGVPDAKASPETSGKVEKKESAKQVQEDIYTGGDHRGGGPHGPLG